MRGIVISVLVGSAISIAFPAAAALILSNGNTGSILPVLILWPLEVTNHLGMTLNCADANSVHEKLTCIRTAFFIDALLYPAIICAFSYLVYRMCFDVASGPPMSGAVRHE